MKELNKNITDWTNYIEDLFHQIIVAIGQENAHKGEWQVLEDEYAKVLEHDHEDDDFDDRLKFAAKLNDLANKVEDLYARVFATKQNKIISAENDYNKFDDKLDYIRNHEEELSDEDESDDEASLGAGWNYDDLISALLDALEEFDSEQTEEYRQIYNYIQENGTGFDD